MAARPPPESEGEQHAVLRDFVHDALGVVRSIKDVSRAFGRQSLVWRIEDGSGTLHFLKQHEERKLYEREVSAYADWIPQLRQEPGSHVPDVRARDDQGGVIILSALPDAVHVTDLRDDPRRVSAFFAAGRFLRALHGLPRTERDVDSAAHMRGLIERLVLPWGNLFEADAFDWIAASLGDGAAFRDAPVVCAHRDYSPRNWLVDATDTLSIIDWERAQEDVWLADVTRMEFDVWPEHPHLRDAFFEGYGRALSPTDAHQLRLATLIHAVGAVSWGRTRGDLEFERLGRATIERLRGKTD